MNISVKTWDLGGSSWRTYSYYPFMVTIAGYDASVRWEDKTWFGSIAMEECVHKLVFQRYKGEFRAFKVEDCINQLMSRSYAQEHIPALRELLHQVFTEEKWI